MANTIDGLEGMTVAELREELDRGARFVVFKYCVSVVVMTFSRETSVKFVRSDESALVKGLPWIALSMAFGWWGFPFGLIYTPIAIVKNLAGGRDVTDQVAPMCWVSTEMTRSNGAARMPSGRDIGAATAPGTYALPDFSGFPSRRKCLRRVRASWALFILLRFGRFSERAIASSSRLVSRLS